ncbi:hypothetical protein [Cytobacillus firmus]|uniref:hypothetical protein n=1 Tax=Cytobacillus firmus TaxID=1399 RepID=UPI001C8E0224|nr:hypothetical protein [Cytobacillus firmus]MBX9974198.1 hypothetical protein [Cytobacillus firmus]
MSFIQQVRTNVYFVGSNYTPKKYSLTYDSQDPNVQVHAELILSSSTSLNAIKIEVINLKYEDTLKDPVSGFDIYIEKESTLLLQGAIRALKRSLAGSGITYDASSRRATNPAATPLLPHQIGFPVSPQPLGWVKVDSTSFYFGTKSLVVTNNRGSSTGNNPRVFLDFEYRPQSRPYCVHFGYRFTDNVVETPANCNNKLEFIIPFEELEQLENGLNRGLNWFTHYGI